MRHLEQVTGRRLRVRLIVAVPAAAMFMLGFARSYPSLARYIYVEAGAAAVALTITFVHARRRARRYQAELDDIDRMTRAR